MTFPILQYIEAIIILIVFSLISYHTRLRRKKPIWWRGEHSLRMSQQKRPARHVQAFYSWWRSRATANWTEWMRAAQTFFRQFTNRTKSIKVGVPVNELPFNRKCVHSFHPVYLDFQRENCLRMLDLGIERILIIGFIDLYAIAFGHRQILFHFG